MIMRSAPALPRLTLLASALLLSAPAIPAELTIDEGVVVKFASQSRLVVRDKFSVGRDAVLTSRRDASVGGSTSPADQQPAKGDWQGLRLEKSAAELGLSLQDFTVRFAAGEEDGAIVWRGFALPLVFPRLFDNGTGLRLLDGASTTVTGGRFLGNGVAIDLAGNSTAQVAGSQFEGNQTALFNRTPQTPAQASGNWWGHASGPRDAVGNPAGQGDAVSSGVNYSGFLSAVPLLNPTLRLATPASYYDGTTVAVELSCANAVSYRLSETSGFSGVPFLPLPGGKLATQFTFSGQDGLKTLYVQYRNITGETVTKALDGGALIDLQAPTVTLSNPAAGSVVSGTISVEAAAADGAGINTVQFYVDGVLARVTAATPYKYSWNTDAVAEGDHVLRVVAVDKAGRSTATERTVAVYRTPLPPDTEAPALANVRLNGTALASGLTLTGNAALQLDASDRSGIARIELLLDGVAVATFSGSNGYSAALDLAAVANGAHVLTLRASDSLNNVAESHYDVTVAHAPPAAPTLAGIANGAVVRATSLDLAGTAPAGAQVQLYLNGTAWGTPLAVTAGGQFTAQVPLAEGSNELRARTLGLHGESALSAALTVVRDTSVPQTPGVLAGNAQPAGLVRLAWAVANDPSTIGYHVYRAATPFTLTGEALRINANLVKTPAFDDLPSTDGSYFYRVVAVNAAGTLSELSNMVQVAADKTAPRAQLALTPQGRVDAATGALGQGRVALTLTVTEALQATPYLAVVPQGGVPMPVNLTRRSATVYDGSLDITAATLSGTANVLFSARDTVGNRGTVLDSGATLSIDTEGPALTAITVTPGAPIRNDGGATLAVSFTLSGPVKPGSTPALAWLLAGGGEEPQPLTGLSSTDGLTWTGSVTLPASAGAAAPASLMFAYSASDALENVSTRITAPNGFQVYQGALPPLDRPLQFLAKAQSGGKVGMSWQAVPDAAAYQLYRLAPGDTDYVALARVSTLEHVDQTPMDGRYRYAVASVRESNGQEALSALTEGVEVVASATAPGAPQNLQLELIGQGIKVSWQPPLSSNVASYRVYRAGGAGIVSVAGLTPLRANIATPLFLDSAPSLTEHAYVVTAVDAAGNESPLSNSAYLNASLLPVATLSVERQNNGLPMLSWQSSRTPVAGYHVYLGSAPNRVRLTDALVTGNSFIDRSYTQGPRQYEVAAVDSAGAEIARGIVLQDVSTQLVSGLPVKRGIMNRLMVQVTNNSGAAVGGGRVVVQLGERRHVSETLSLSAYQTRLVPVVVGGYADLPASAPARLGFEIEPNEGESMSLVEARSFDVTDGALVVGIATEDFTRGATGKVRLTIENTSEVDVELLSARNGGQPSDELRFKLLDKDGNVLAVQPYLQVLGNGYVSLSNGLTVARIPAGAAFTSEPFTLAVPGSAPADVRLRLEIDKLRYNSGRPDQVIIGGRGAEAPVSLVDTRYTAEVTEATPATSFGDEDVVISGRAIDRATQASVPGTRVKLQLNQQGFERTLELVTDQAGNFSYVFTPGYADGGVYKVGAVHPDISDKPEQKSFTIQRVAVGPNVFRLSVPRNYGYTVPFNVSTGLATSATNVRLVLDESTYAKPAGVNVTLPAAITVAPRQTLNTPVTFTADNSAPASGKLQFKAYADERPTVPIGLLTLEYMLTEARPSLVASPSFVETGLAMGSAGMESFVLENKGLQDALDLQLALTLPDGTPAPAWVSLASNANGTLKAGEKRTVQLSFTPPTTLAAGIYEFRVRVQGGNVPVQALNVFAAVTASGEGNALFKVADIYTATLDKSGRLIPGLAGARIMVQNEDVPTVAQTLVSDSLGEAYFQNLPAGFYKFKATATNHQELNGRFVIKPGITATQPIFLDYNVVTVEWSVREITIEDRYELTLNATFETDVPTAVVLMEPLSTNLPAMEPGQVYYGELTLTNYGLVRADNLRSSLPTSDAFFRYEFLAPVPESLEAKSRVVIPYRIVGLTSLENSGTASGGGCYSYVATGRVNYESECANGDTTQGSAQTRWSRGSSTTCPSGSGSGGSVGGGGTIGGGSIGGGGGVLGGGGVTYSELPGQQICEVCPDGDCNGGGGGGQ